MWSVYVVNANGSAIFRISVDTNLNSSSSTEHAQDKKQLFSDKRRYTLSDYQILSQALENAKTDFSAETEV